MDGGKFFWQQATISFRQLQPGADAALQETAARFEDCAADAGRGVIFGRGKVFFVASGNLLPAAAAGADAALQDTAARFEDCAADVGRGVVFGRG